MADIKPLPGFSGETMLLSGSHRFSTHTVLGFCAADVTKDASVSGIFNDIPPLNGGWTLELAVELVHLLPSLDGTSEAIIDAIGPDGTVRKLCLSNRMSRFHFADATESHHALIPRERPWHGAAQVQAKGGAKLPAAEEQLRSVAAMQFAITGATAEHAFESSIARSLETFLFCINAALRAARACRRSFTPVTRAMRRDSIPGVYVLMIGDGKEGGARLALNVARISLIPEMFDAEQAERFRQLMNGSASLSDVDRLLGEAQSSYEDGEYEFAFLQAVIAAEIATARRVRSQCMSRGVSKSKLDDNRKEMTYSWALNIGLPLCFPADRRPKAELVASMNAARTKRNDLMHEGVFSISRQELGKLLSDTKEYLEGLTTAAAPSSGDAAPSAAPT
jgi:hypothetical protein